MKNIINAKLLSKIAFNCIAIMVKKSDVEEISRQYNFFYPFPYLENAFLIYIFSNCFVHKHSSICLIIETYLSYYSNFVDY